MAAKTDNLIKVLTVISWIIFVGVCVEAGGFITNTFFTLLYTPAGADKFWAQVNLTELYYFNQSYYVITTSLMIIVALMRSVMFYVIVKNLHVKELNFSAPFNETMKRFIFNIAYLSLGIGLFSFMGANFAEEFVKQGVKMPEIQYLRMGGADVWLFMSVILFVIAQIFKRGIELQNENDLTV